MREYTVDMDVFALISDIHSNREALDAVLDDIADGIPIFCLGDIAGYGPDLDYCIDRLRSEEIPCLMGNHDAALAGDLSLAWFSSAARAALALQMRELSPQNREWFAALPRSGAADDFLLVHGAPPESYTEYLLGWRHQEAKHFMEETQSRHCAVGHTHVPFVTFGKPDRHGALEWTPMSPPGHGETYDIPENGRALINPGSVGQPRDRVANASYAIIALSKRTIEIRRVQYPIEVVQRKIRDAGLPTLLAERLAEGM